MFFFPDYKYNVIEKSRNIEKYKKRKNIWNSSIEK